MRYALAAWSVLLIVGCFSPVRSQEPQGRLIVKVMDEETGEPVPGAKVHAHLGILEPVEEMERRITGADGKCEIAAPWGHLRLSTPMPPVGYWMPQKMFGRLTPQESLAITRGEPIIERSFTARKGVVWPVKVLTEDGKPLAGAGPHAMGKTFGSSRGGVGTTDAMGEGLLSLPPEGGDVVIHCSFRPNLTALPQRVTLHIDPGFDHKNVVRQSRAAQGDRIEVFDDQGRKVSCEGCRIAIRERASQVVLEVPEPVGPSLAVEVAGRVVDHTGQPVKDATVMGGGYGLPTGDYSKQTDVQGNFRLRGLVNWSPPGEYPGVRIMVSKDGFTGTQLSQLFAGTEGAVVQLKDPLVLRRGFSARVQVLDEDGRPVEGAWAEYNLPGFQIPKTDTEGFCTIANLPEGKTSVRFSYGQQAARASIEVSPADSPAPATVVRLKRVGIDPLAAASSRRPRLKPLAVGEAAPEWRIRQWTDGKDHSLAALRGKIVVIEFWSMGCRPCKEITMPASSVLEPKFAQDVAFVHIHPAAEKEELSLVRQWLDIQSWNLLVGFDDGTSTNDSTTLKRYGVDGFPAVFIIDRQGRIIDNDETSATEAEEVATRKALTEEAGLPWPIDKDASEGELLRRLRIYHQHVMTKKIQAALGAK